MPEPCLKILLIENDPADAALIQNLLSEGEGLGFYLEWVQALLPGLDQLAKGDVDVVLADLRLPDIHGLDAVATLRMHAPAVPIVLLSEVNSDALALRAVQIGAQDFLVKSRLDSELLSNRLLCAIARQKSQTGSAKAEAQISPVRAIGCLGAKGGVGTTTIACHTALELKRQTGQRVLVVDLNMSGGSVDLMTQVKSTYSIVDAANDLLRLDRSFWEKVVLKGPEDLEILPLAAPICSEEQIRSDRIRYVLRFVRSLYPWIVIDLGRLSPFSAGLLAELTDLLLVTTFDLASVTETRRAVDSLAEMGFESRLVTLVVNRVPKSDGVAAREVSKMLGIPASFMLPEGSAGLRDSKSSVRSQVARLAANLAGLTQDPPAWKRFLFPAASSAKNRQLKIA
jgi:pilus assembly protein CpaE